MTLENWNAVLSDAKKAIAILSSGRSFYELDERARELAVHYFESVKRRERKGKPPIKSPFRWMMLAGREFINRWPVDYQLAGYQLAEYANRLPERNKAMPFRVENIGKQTPLAQLYIILVAEGRAAVGKCEKILLKLFSKRAIKCSPNVLSPRHGVSDIQWLKDAFDMAGAELKNIKVTIYKWGVSTAETDPRAYGCAQDRAEGVEYAY